MVLPTEHELRRATHGGSTSVVIDLTGVTHLASAGVAVLTRARRHAAGSAALRLIAPPGTPADQILTLVQIPRDADEETNPVADE